jgi:hypothetical protein
MIMPVMLITEDEKLVWKDEETQSGFYYRRPSIHVHRELSAKNSEKGLTNSSQLVEDLIEWSVTGWFGFIDRSHKEVLFDKKYLTNGAVPDHYKARFVAALYSLNPEVAELGN